MSDRAWGLNISSSATKFSDFKHNVGKLEFLWADYYTKIFFVCPRWSSGPYIPRNFLIWTHFVNASWKKKRTYARTFPVQLKKIIVNVVTVRFTMMYSSRKLNNKKAITTACNFWRQIACYFQVYGRIILILKNHFCAKSTRKNLFWISRFFSPDQHWCHKLFFPTIFPNALRRLGPKNSNF